MFNANQIVEEVIIGLGAKRKFNSEIYSKNNVSGIP